MLFHSGSAYFEFMSDFHPFFFRLHLSQSIHTLTCWFIIKLTHFYLPSSPILTSVRRLFNLVNAYLVIRIIINANEQTYQLINMAPNSACSIFLVNHLIEIVGNWVHQPLMWGRPNTHFSPCLFFLSRMCWISQIAENEPVSHLSGFTTIVIVSGQSNFHKK